MNGAIYDATFNMFYKLRYAKTYDAILSTPLGIADVAVGEISWALIRGTLYAIGFLVAMAVLGLIESPWILLAVPGRPCSSATPSRDVGTAATTSGRSVEGLRLGRRGDGLPLFLFSATFYPITVCPEPLRTLISVTPLSQSVELLRALALGTVGPGLLVHVAYLVLMGLAGLFVVRRRLAPAAPQVAGSKRGSRRGAGVPGRGGRGLPPMPAAGRVAGAGGPREGGQVPR